MDNDDINKALDDILVEVDKKANQISEKAHEGVAKIDDSIPGTDKTEVEEAVSIGEEVKEPEIPDSKASKTIPFLKEKKEDPLFIPPKKKEEEEKDELDVPSFGKAPEVPPFSDPVYTDKRKITKMPGEPDLAIPPKKAEVKDDGLSVPKFGDEPKVPDIKAMREKSVGEVVIPKKGSKKEISSDLLKKKKEVVKKIIIAMTIVALAAGASVHALHSVPVDSYEERVPSIENFIDYAGDAPVEETTMGEVGNDIGYAIANEVIIHCLTIKDEEYDVNKAFVKYLAVAHDRIVKSLIYTEKGAGGKGLLGQNRYWMDSIYLSAAKELTYRGVMEGLPETFDEYLQANGFYNGILEYNNLKNSLEKQDVEEVTKKDAIKNLSAYGNYLIGHSINPEKAVSQKFHEAIERILEVFFDKHIVYDKEGIHIKDENYNDEYITKSVDPLIIEQVNSDEESVSHGRN